MSNRNIKKIFLASASPRRRKLLKNIGLPFKAAASNYQERLDYRLSPAALAKRLSLKKAEAMANQGKEGLIISADTLVVCGKKYLGKPKNRNEAVKMLKKISGRRVLVITGYTVWDTANSKKTSRSSTTKVFIRKLTDSEITNYIKTNEAYDKAGAFAIQGVGGWMIKKIEGDYFNVIGLPIFPLMETLRKYGVRII